MAENGPSRPRASAAESTATGGAASAAPASGATSDAAAGRGAEGDELRYFQALEEAFIRLRGAPLLLSPADWLVAQRWRAAGIPLDFAIASVAELFAKRRERGNEDRISSLRYCARAVETAWRRVQDLAGPGRRTGAAPALDTERRVRALAGAIPPGWARDGGIPERVLALRGDAAAVESALVAIDDQMLASAAARLSASETAELDAWVRDRLEPLRSRFDPDEIASAAHRLRSRELRRRASLPLLSLFSADAEDDGDRS
jgi:hypothetical protein